MVRSAARRVSNHEATQADRWPPTLGDARYASARLAALALRALLRDEAVCTALLRQILHVVRQKCPHLGAYRERGLRHPGRVGAAGPLRHEAERLLRLLGIGRIDV